MSDDPVIDPEPSTDPVDPPTDPVDPPQSDPTDWKAMARKHEREKKAIRDELEELRRTQMTDAEKAIAEAKAAGRTEALTETGKILAAAEFRSAAAEAGLKIADVAEFIDSARFVNDDGTVDTEGITAAVERFASIAPPAVKQPTADPQGGPPSTPGQLTRADLARMTPDQIVEAKAAGRLNDVLGVKA